MTDNKRIAGLKQRLHQYRAQNLTIPKRVSKYRGVYWDNNIGAWIAVYYYTSNHTRKRIDLGHYPVEEDAARAWDEKSIQFWGDRAFTNFPRENTPTEE
jgi:hypothetical protein